MKYLLWIVAIFAVLLALRLLNASKARRRADAAREARRAQEGGPANDTMVRCVRCGVYLPRADAKPSPVGLTCGDPACLQQR